MSPWKILRFQSPSHELMSMGKSYDLLSASQWFLKSANFIAGINLKDHEVKLASLGN